MSHLHSLVKARRQDTVQGIKLGEGDSWSKNFEEIHEVMVNIIQHQLMP